MLWNWLLMDPFIDSIAVSIPTRAIIPKAIINTVNTVRIKFERIELAAILKFSFIKAFENIVQLIICQK